MRDFKFVNIFKIIILLICALVCINSIALAQSSDAQSNVFYKTVTRLNDPPKKANEHFAVGYNSDNDSLTPSVLSNWIEKRQDKNGGSNKKDYLDVEKVTPETATHEVFRPIPELAQRALVQGDFISKSIDDSLTDAALVNTFAALGMSSSLANATYKAQVIADDRLDLAIKSYQLMYETQMNGEDFAAKEAFTALNSCIYKRISGKGGGDKTSWIVALYHCMGEADPTKPLDDNQKVKDSNVYQGGEDPWDIAKHTVWNEENNIDQGIVADLELEKKKDLTVNALLFLYKSSDSGQGRGSDELKKVAKSWREWFGDYKLKFTEQAAGSNGSQVKKITEEYVKPKITFQDISQELIKKRCEDFKKLWFYDCDSKLGNGGQSSGDSYNDDHDPWNPKNLGKQHKQEIWNLSVPEMPMQESIIRPLTAMLKFERLGNVSDNNGGGSSILSGATGGSNSGEGICKPIESMCDGMGGGNSGGNVSEVTTGKTSLMFAQRYVEFVVISQLLHSVALAQEFAWTRSAGIDDIGRNVSEMAQNLIARASGIPDIGAALAKNTLEWQGLIAKLNANAQEKTGSNLGLTGQQIVHIRGR